MSLNTLLKSLRDERTAGRFVLLPFGWVIAAMLALSRVSAPPPPSPEPVEIVDTIAPEPLPPTDSAEPPPRVVSPQALFADLRQPLDLAVWTPSTYPNELPSAHYGGPWVAENIVPTDEALVLMVRKGVDGARPTMAEIQSNEKYGFGRYNVIMRPSGESGTVSAFFTFTSEWTGDPHDEVDIEFIGRRSGFVEYNYWKSGRPGAHSGEKLGFDAADELNLYSIDWTSDEIVWYVNGEEHYRSPPGDTGIPTHPSKIMFSIWTGKERMEVWTGPRKFGDSAEAEFACISFTPFEDESYSCADLWDDDPQFNVDD